MNINIKNIENGEGRNWIFESDLGSTLMMEILATHIGQTPEHACIDGLGLITVSVTNAQLDCILANVPDDSDPFIDLFLPDIRLLRYGNVTVH
jgi:hypothetical protein